MNKLNISDFDFELPKELIAQHPTKERDGSKLLVCLTDKDPIKENFGNILDYIKPDDLIIFNDSKVINAQLTLFKDKGSKSETQGYNLHKQCCNLVSCKNNEPRRRITVNLYKQLDDHRWEAMGRPGKHLKIGDEFIFGDNRAILESKDEVLVFRFDLKNLTLFEFLEKYGTPPLPPYIKRPEELEEDKERYQSIFAKHPGSVAAPTASLHFSEKIIDGIKQIGAEICFVTLHVGAGTYMPIKGDDIENHVMHSEYASISKEVSDKINKAKSAGRRVIAVGTTAMRVLESFANKSKNQSNSLTSDGELMNSELVSGELISHGTQSTDIFIKPGYEFSIADMLVTNFHLPKSTLFMLVCAFAGTKEMHRAYEYAIKEKMRFFSYGDAMLLEHK